MKIAFTTQLPAVGFSRLQAYELLPVGVFSPQAEILVATFDYKVDAALMRQMPNLRLVANFGVGYNNIDLDYCREHSICVTNTPNPVIEPTAELAFSLMHAVARRTAELDRRMRNHTTEPFGVMNNLGHSLFNKTLGIIGMGQIGRALARRALASGMNVIYHNRHELENTSYARYVSLDELLTTADFVSLNLPYYPEVHHLIGEKELHMMKPSAYLINTARGAHVDEQALVQALYNKEIAGAAMDVYEHEPNVCSELLTMDNVVLSPHVGTGTMEDRLLMCENVTDNILYFLRGEQDKMNLVKL